MTKLRNVLLVNYCYSLYSYNLDAYYRIDYVSVLHIISHLWMSPSYLTATITFETWLSFIKIAKGNTTTATNQYRKCFRFLPMSCSHVIIVFHTFQFVTDDFPVAGLLFFGNKTWKSLSNYQSSNKRKNMLKIFTTFYMYQVPVTKEKYIRNRGNDMIGPYLGWIGLCLSYWSNETLEPS